MENTEPERFWCGQCGRAHFPHESGAPDSPICPGCGGEMKPLNELTKTERSTLAFQDWSEEVAAAGKWGPSPGGAMSGLGCDLSMIDWLAERRILEKSVYDRDGIYVVMISRRSIDKAKENKKGAAQVDGLGGGLIQAQTEKLQEFDPMLTLREAAEILGVCGRSFQRGSSPSWARNHSSTNGPFSTDYLFRAPPFSF